MREEGQEGREGVHGVDPSAAGAALGLVLSLFRSVYWDVTSSRIRLPCARDGVTVPANVQKRLQSSAVRPFPPFPPARPQLDPHCTLTDPTGPPEPPKPR